MKEKKIKPAVTQQIKSFFAKITNGIIKLFKTIIKKYKALSKKGKAILISIILAILAIVIACFSIYYVQYGYVKPYEKEYGITYPKGIQKDFCDAYGMDPTIRGDLSIPDDDQSTYVANKKSDSYAYLQNGSTIDNEQQFNSIRTSKEFIDLEKLYSTPDGFLKASQAIVFNTLYEKQMYKVIGCYYTNTVAEKNENYIFPYNLFGDMTQRSFAEFQDKLQSRRLYDTGYGFNYYDKFLTVAVDSDFMPNYVFVVVGVRVDGKVKKSKIAEPNEKIHYPQSYYDKNKENNPYTYAPKWYPEIYIEGKPSRLNSMSFLN